MAVHFSCDVLKKYVTLTSGDTGMETISWLTEKSADLIAKRLKVSDVDKLISRDYEIISKDNDINHSDAEKYSKKYRGSVRISNGKYYTFSEYDDFVNNAKAIHLP